MGLLRPALFFRAALAGARAEVAKKSRSRKKVGGDPRNESEQVRPAVV
jgi:hypothetical protein